MDKVKKILSSPMSKRKNQSQPPSPSSPSGHSNGLSPTQARALAVRYFGVPLDDIVRREGTEVPRLVSKVCAYIMKHGRYLGFLLIRENCEK